jgi:hypothetical protein
MQPQANPHAGNPAPAPWPAEATSADLVAALAPHGGKALVFAYDGRDLLPGYHVTEVKAASFASLDCGAQPESWQETVIQLWDVPAEPGRAPMTVGKFLAILRKVAEQVAMDDEAKLTFEISDGARPMQVFTPAAIELEADKVRVALRPRPASCKPRDRWLEQQTAKASEKCCGPSNNASKCCN